LYSALKVLGSAPSIILSYTLIGFLVFTTSFTAVANDIKEIENAMDTEGDCSGILEDALGYNAFVRYETQLGGGDTEGPVATGGNLTMNGLITVAAHTAGTNYFNGDSEASSLVVGGRVVYKSGQGIHLNQGFMKIGNSSGSSVYDRDYNNASANTRVTSGGYDAMPRIQVQRKQPKNSVKHGGLIDFEAAFASFESKALQLSTLDANLTINQYNKIWLANDQVNVLNITGNELQALSYLTFENKPNRNTPLIINVDASGDFEWNVFNMAGIGDQEGRFILWNFFNATTITFKGGSTIVGTVFAPKSSIIKKSSGNINGQVIAQNYYHKAGELHQHIYTPCIDTPTTECALSVDAGNDVSICGDEDLTLTATVSGASECCVQYDIVNTKHCKNGKRYVLWLSDGKRKHRYYRDGGLSWTEYPDGTATLKGKVKNIRNSRDVLIVDITYSGKTVTPPSDSPKNHWCRDENTSGWQYYTKVTGTVKKRNSPWWTFKISERGPAFQLGNGANITEKNKGRLGASGWFNTTHRKYKIGDFNFNIGDCEEKSSEVSYLWSTGETTQSITVNEPGVYTVEVQDCENCVAETEVKVEEIKLEVDAGKNQEICKGDEITLTAEVHTECKECVEYGITDTEMCTGNGRKFALWLYNPTTTAGRFFTNVDLVWKLGAEGTATLKGKVYNSVIDQNYIVDLVFTGQTSTPPTSGSPKEHFCYDEDASSWIYYPEYSGTISSEDGTWSTTISRNGPAFQLGNGANTNELVEGRFSASGWFNTTDSEFTFGDININLDCIKYEPKGIEYLWSTGDTTQSITVSPEESTTYEVTVSGCGDCVASDTVEVIVNNPPQVDLGEDQNICQGEEIVLNASVEGEGECEVCVDYGITDTEMCTGNGRKYAVWLYNTTTTSGRFLTNVDLVWSENDNGTATLKGKVYHDVSDEYYELDVMFTGKTNIPPSDESPKSHFCYEENASGWQYYTEYSGTISKIGDNWSITISNTGPAFQVGNGANTNEMVEGRFSASGWFEIANGEFDFGDININLDCIKYEPKGIEYLWSTGETTQSITVSPIENTTYTVTINGCTDCGEDTDSVEVTVINCEGNVSGFEAPQNAEIYPTRLRPNDKLYIDVSDKFNDQDISIAIYDITGIEIGTSMHRSVTNTNISIDLNQYRVYNGIYVVKIVGHNWTQTERIVIDSRQ